MSVTSGQRPLSAHTSSFQNYVLDSYQITSCEHRRFSLGVHFFPRKSWRLFSRRPQNTG